MNGLFSMCRITIVFAYLMVVLVLASIYYYVKTRTINRPFRGSLTQHQLFIQDESSQIRKDIFYQGIIGAIIVMTIFRPFNKCVINKYL